MLVIVAIAGLLHHDVRDGMATVEANRREYRSMLEFEIPVLALALVSLRWQKKFFWIGWAIHAAFTGLRDSNRDLAGVFLALVRREGRSGRAKSSGIKPLLHKTASIVLG